MKLLGFLPASHLGLGFSEAHLEIGIHGKERALLESVPRNTDRRVRKWDREGKKVQL